MIVARNLSADAAVRHGGVVLTYAAAALERGLVAGGRGNLNLVLMHGDRDDPTAPRGSLAPVGRGRDRARLKHWPGRHLADRTNR